MDLENLKQVWNEEKIESIPEISLEKQKEIHTPLEMIRKNMRTEFWTSIVFFLLWAVSSPFSGMDIKHTYLLVILILTAFVIIGYYYLKFYTFYKKLNTQNLNTYHNILDLRYELVLNSELYKSFYIASIPFILGFYYASYVDNKDFNLSFFSIISLSFCVLIYFIGKYWLYENYGKYIQQISKIIAEITGEEDGFEYDRSFLKIQKEFVFLQKTRNFCNEKFGKYGQIVYIKFLLILVLLISFLVGICVAILHIILTNYLH
jgi:hypothetical protein